MSDDVHEYDSRLELRLLRAEDYPAVAQLQHDCFPGVLPWSQAVFEEQLRRFPEGQVGITFDGQLAVTSSALLVTGSDWDDQHTLEEVSSGGTIRNHEPDGDTLYGIDLAVAREHRGKRLARRIYEYRRALMQRMNVRRMFIAGRIPGLQRHPDLTPEVYVQQVLAKEFADPTMTVQLAMGFYVLRVLNGYMPNDVESRGAAVLMEWINPAWMPHSPSARRTARVASVQYRMRPVSSFEEFQEQCTYYADLASDFRCDFLLYPELLTNQLIPLTQPQRPALRVRELERFTERYITLFRDLAIRHNVNIIGGTHLAVEEETLYNIAWLFHRDGRVDKQYKLHITPSEARWWGVAPGRHLQAFDTDRGRIGILICYDIEFPELARVLKHQGANMIFVPYNTELRTGHIRVRTCAHARCIENNVYVVTSGMCGGLPSVEWAEIHFGRSAVLTPSDIPFPRDGIGAEANDNVETLVVYDVDFTLLRKMQRQGAVRTWLDRRLDLYSLTWNEGDGTVID